MHSMPDLGPLVSSLLELIAPLMGRSLRSLLATAAGMALFTLLLTIGAVLVAADGSVLQGVLGAVLALVLGTGVGVVLSGKRAVGAALAEGVRRLALGNKVLGLLFVHLLRVEASQALGERGVAVARATERLPLAQAQARLEGTMRDLLSAAPAGGGVKGWLARKVQEKALGEIEAITLARFREQGAQEGGVDLIKVRDELAAKIDGLLVERIERGLLMVTLLAVLATSAVTLGGAYLIRQAPFS
jgi:hypothetical protein